MKKIILLILLFNVCTAFAFENISLPFGDSGISDERAVRSSESEKLKSGNGVSTQYEYQSNISKEEFSALEKKIFKKTFDSDTSKARLERLEKEIFGMLQKGDEQERFENLITASDYYASGYRPNTDNQNIKPKINPKDYIVNYNFDDSNEDREYSYSKQPDYGDYESVKPNKKSKFLQFLSDIADALTSGVVTGYTLPIDDFGTDIINGINVLGGGNYIGVPQFPTYYPQRPIRRHNYRPHPYYYPNHYYQSPSRYNHTYMPAPPRYNNYYSPYGNGRSNYNTGSKVKIIY